MDRVCIVGSAGFNLDVVTRYVKALPKPALIITGGSRAVHRAAELAARSAGLSTLILPAYWESYKADAPLIRNYALVRAAARMVAFWNGKSRTTKHAIRVAGDQGRPVTIYYPDGRSIRWRKITLKGSVTGRKRPLPPLTCSVNITWSRGAKRTSPSP